MNPKQSQFEFKKYPRQKMIQKQSKFGLKKSPPPKKSKWTKSSQNLWGCNRALLCSYLRYGSALYAQELDRVLPDAHRDEMGVQPCALVLLLTLWKRSLRPGVRSRSA